MLQTNAFNYRCMCGKIFKTERRFKMHNTMCHIKLFSQSSQEREDEEREINEVPSQLEMYKIIIAQQREIDNLKTMLSNLERTGTTQKKKKTDIISYLNEKYQPEIDAHDWLKQLSFDENHYGILCDTGFADSVIASFQDNMTVQGSQVLPIQGFTQKSGILFKYENKTWSAVTNSDFKQFMEIIFPIILKRHKSWESTYLTDITNEKQQDMLLDRMNRIFCLPPYTDSNRDTRIKSGVYNFIKKKLPVESNITLSYDV